MAGAVHIADPVVTGDSLARQHQGEEEVRVAARAVITPTGWDYIRQHRLRVVRGEPDPPPQSQPVPASSAPPDPQIAEVRPLSAEEMRLVQEGRCDHPDRPYGCETDEFGSGFVEPSSCCECGVEGERKKPGTSDACGGCNRQKTVEPPVDPGRGADIEALVQYITDEIMARLEG